MREMPPFERRCPKCGSQDLDIEHQEERPDETVDIVGFRHPPHPERIYCSCEDCGFYWYAKPLDVE